ncbi:cactin [Diplocarpon rosae]|nr:cactin [Diplocarpon rosae]
MDPGRRAMISGRDSPARDLTAPRRDQGARISKPPRPPGMGNRPDNRSRNNQSSLEDEQTRKWVSEEDSFVLKQAKKKADIRSYEQLEALETQIRAKLRSNEPIDVDYWEQLLRSLLIWKAKAKLKKVYQSVLDSRLEKLRKEQLEDAEGVRSKMRELLSGPITVVEEGTETSVPGADVSQFDRRQPHFLFSPKYDPEPLLKLHSEDKSSEIVDESIFLQKIVAERRRVLKLGYVPLRQANNEKSVSSSSKVTTTSTVGIHPPGTQRFSTAVNEDFSQATKALYEREVARGVDEDEEIFTGEETVTKISEPQWADKYRPRKPRYFNRVQMGYEWNKYNQTHYDHDNPPPKVVQGYKFNIFYPDLIDKAKAPTYKIFREHGRKRGESFAPAGEEDTCLIRFIAGPPYEDIAFRIVDREWDFSAKRDRGFRSSFDKQSSFQRTPPHPSLRHITRPHREQSPFAALPAVFTMNPGQYQCHPPMPGLLPDDFQYDRDLDQDSVLSGQATLPMLSCDGLPRTSSQHLMNSATASDNLSTDYNLFQPIPMSHSSISWSDPNQSSRAFEDPTNSYYGYESTNISGNGHNDSFLRGSGIQQVPRFVPNMFSLNDNTPFDESFAPASYLLDSNRNGLQNSPVMHSPFETQHMMNARDLQRMSISQSPIPKMESEDSKVDFSAYERPPPFCLPSSESSEEGKSSREMTAAEGDDHNPDEPYAKLIYRALMSRPDHSMVLQEIYQWFRDNTQKGGTDSKGWMNSIRHNLSMNAAFKKTERKIPETDAKKSTEWVLEDFAIKDGVQSTTRYRKGTGAKKFIRSDTPSLSRVVSGRRGGFSTKAAKLQRQRERQQRAKGDQRDPARADSFYRNQNFQQQQAQSQAHMPQHYVSQRQRSPLTPPSASDPVASPYFFGKQEEPDSPFDMYRLDEIHGVCVDDGPVFSNGGADAHFPGSRPMSNHHY